MIPDQTYQPEYESLKELLIQMASERSTEVLLKLVVKEMSQRPHVGFVRIWLKEKGDMCESCKMAANCKTNCECLHLKASAGESISTNDWSDLNGHGSRIPVGFSSIGKIAQKKRALTQKEVDNEKDWQKRNIWAENENILGFGAQPILYKDDVLGVIAIYSRIHASRVKEGKFWLKMIAHHTASAIANANAFNRIDQLKSQLELENEYLREEINQSQAFGDIVGKSPSLMNILNQIELVAPTDAAVFIFGESGTGKELVAREIHKRSLRKDKPMIKVNCATIPKELYESEFFGHVRGAFTGAVKDRAGRFQAADGGTLFLDEIGELPLSLQGKLLRVLQEGTYERIGEETTRQVNVRIIAATNRNIKQDIKQGKFRQDLYYRLNVFPIDVAPLRERKEDIEPLVFHFLKKSASNMKKGIEYRISGANMNKLMAYSWPGNVRELKNVIERSVIISKNSLLKFDFLDISKEKLYQRTDISVSKLKEEVMTEAEIHHLIKRNIINALKSCNGKIYGNTGAAFLLGIAPTTLSSRIKKNNIEAALFRQ